jgi:hypothetical protein
VHDYEHGFERKKDEKACGECGFGLYCGEEERFMGRRAARTAYGKRLLADLAESLTAEFGNGFDASNLRYMRLFYQAFPKCDAQRYELSWTHYRSLLRIDEFDLFFPRVSANSNLLIFV